MSANTTIAALRAHHINGGRLSGNGVADLFAEIDRLQNILNTPEHDDFARAVVHEAKHQANRHGAAHDDAKSPWDWFWLLGYLGQKAAEAARAGDVVKARHHTITAAAALANWHARLGKDAA